MNSIDTIGWLELEKWVEPFVWQLQKAHLRSTQADDLASTFPHLETAISAGVVAGQ